MRNFRTFGDSRNLVIHSPESSRTESAEIFLTVLEGNCVAPGCDENFLREYE
jgi:hypothetical protein